MTLNENINRITVTLIIIYYYIYIRCKMYGNFEASKLHIVHDTEKQGISLD